MPDWKWNCTMSGQWLISVARWSHVVFWSELTENFTFSFGFFSIKKWSHVTWNAELITLSHFYHFLRSRCISTTVIELGWVGIHSMLTILHVQVFGGWKYQIVERVQTCDQIKFRSRRPNIKCLVGNCKLCTIHTFFSKLTQGTTLVVEVQQNRTNWF